MPNTILIYKTNINTLAQIRKVDTILSKRSEIKNWNIDIDDCDKVLRIETSKPEMQNVIGILKPHYIYCEEME
ncbi:MAG: hypothetical protein ACXVPU_10320 [Bacteroidia bacterium]